MGEVDCASKTVGVETPPPAYRGSPLVEGAFSQSPLSFPPLHKGGLFGRQPAFRSIRPSLPTHFDGLNGRAMLARKPPQPPLRGPPSPQGECKGNKRFCSFLYKGEGKELLPSGRCPATLTTTIIQTVSFSRYSLWSPRRRRREILSLRSRMTQGKVFRNGKFLFVRVGGQGNQFRIFFTTSYGAKQGYMRMKVSNNSI